MIFCFLNIFNRLFFPFYSAKTSFDHYKKVIEEIRDNLSGEELTDKTEEDIQIMQEDMETEELKLKQTREKVSKELQRRRAQVEQEKSKLDEISAKVSKCKNFQELHEKHETQLKSQLVEIGKGNRNVFSNHQIAVRSIFKNLGKWQL